MHLASVSYALSPWHFKTWRHGVSQAMNGGGSTITDSGGGSEKCATSCKPLAKSCHSLPCILPMNTVPPVSGMQLWAMNATPLSHPLHWECLGGDK